MRDLTSELALDHGGSILLAVMDGVGDISVPQLKGRTPLEAAATPNLDRLASRAALGQHIPVARGITPGSGPGHLALFGYDPVECLVGRGALAALGIGFQLNHGDLAARINFCTIDGNGVVTDRRAGRISTDECARLADMLKGIEISGVQTFVEPVKEHRACVVFRGAGLSENIQETDPGLVGEKPLPVKALSQDAEFAAGVVKEFVEKAMGILNGEKPANPCRNGGYEPRPRRPGRRGEGGG